MPTLDEILEAEAMRIDALPESERGAALVKFQHGVDELLRKGKEEERASPIIDTVQGAALGWLAGKYGGAALGRYVTRKSIPKMMRRTGLKVSVGPAQAANYAQFQAKIIGVNADPAYIAAKAKDPKFRAEARRVMRNSVLNAHVQQNMRAASKVGRRAGAAVLAAYGGGSAVYHNQKIDYGRLQEKKFLQGKTTVDGKTAPEILAEAQAAGVSGAAAVREARGRVRGQSDKYVSNTARYGVVGAAMGGSGGVSELTEKEREQRRAAARARWANHRKAEKAEETTMSKLEEFLAAEAARIDALPERERGIALVKFQLGVDSLLAKFAPAEGEAEGEGEGMEKGIGSALADAVARANLNAAVTYGAARNAAGKAGAKAAGAVRGAERRASQWIEGKGAKIGADMAERNYMRNGARGDLKAARRNASAPYRAAADEAYSAGRDAAGRGGGRNMAGVKWTEIAQRNKDLGEGLDRKATAAGIRGGAGTVQYGRQAARNTGAMKGRAVARKATIGALAGAGAAAGAVGANAVSGSLSEAQIKQRRDAARARWANRAQSMG